tara:strand:- start:45 stop:251 length:207 start_codon:yes stop_codon:yes gene_type:complete
MLIFDTAKRGSEIAESIGLGGMKRDGLAERGGRIFEPVEMEQGNPARAITPGMVGPLLNRGRRHAFSF